VDCGGLKTMGAWYRRAMMFEALCDALGKAKNTARLREQVCSLDPSS
jgi:hypothetical protein